LSILAIKYLNILATSTTIEGNFNSSINIITKRRTNLKHKTWKELLILKYNKKEKESLKIKKQLDLYKDSSSKSEIDLEEGDNSDFN
jgi:uncharacterized protein YqgV (UPF0045/DUF77 family)